MKNLEQILLIFLKNINLFVTALLFIALSLQALSLSCKGALSSCGVLASHFIGSSYCGACVVVQALSSCRPGLQNTDRLVVAHKLFHQMWDLSLTGIEPVSLHWQPYS